MSDPLPRMPSFGPIPEAQRDQFSIAITRTYAAYLLCDARTRRALAVVAPNLAHELAGLDRLLDQSVRDVIERTVEAPPELREPGQHRAPEPPVSS